jgi:hypothetical protein
MKIALVRNIGAAEAREKSAAAVVAGGSATRTPATSDMQADGILNGVPMRLLGHFEARGNRFYQVVVMGPAKAIEPEPADQFISSFKPE